MLRLSQLKEWKGIVKVYSAAYRNWPSVLFRLALTGKARAVTRGGVVIEGDDVLLGSVARSYSQALAVAETNAISNVAFGTMNMKGERVTLTFPNGFTITIDGDELQDMLNLYVFALKYGVNVGRSWKLDEKERVVITPDGIRFSLRGFDPLIFAETFLYDTHFVDFDLEGRKVIHAGAYVGETALYYAKRGAYVYAFEPQRECFEIAQRNLELNPGLASRIVLRNWALGDDGEIEFPDTKCNGGASYFDDYRRRVRVRSVSVSTILREFGISKPDILDIDIKGSEFQLIKDKALREFDVVRIEYQTVIGNKKIGDVSYLLEKLREYGFAKIRVFKHNELPLDLSINGTIVARK